MFDKKQIIHNHHSSQVNINEHRAPTDDSIRLAEEFRGKALKDIISKETVRNNTLNYEVFIVRKSFGVQIVVSAMINGKLYEIRRDLLSDYAKKFIQKNVDNGDITNLNLQEKLRIMEYELLMSILLRSMFDISKDEFAKL